jgi:hypothetical protein
MSIQFAGERTSAGSYDYRSLQGHRSLLQQQNANTSLLQQQAVQITNKQTRREQPTNTKIETHVPKKDDKEQLQRLQLQLETAMLSKKSGDEAIRRLEVFKYTISTHFGNKTPTLNRPDFDRYVSGDSTKNIESLFSM